MTDGADGLKLHFLELDSDMREWRISVEMSEADALDLASGYVPTHVKAQLREMLAWHEEDQRRAARPVRPRKQAR